MGSDVFQKYLPFCALEKITLSIERFKHVYICIKQSVWLRYS